MKKSQVDRESSAVQSHTATNNTELEGRVLQQLSFVRLLDFKIYILGVAPSQDASEHQDYDIFSRESRTNLYLPVSLEGATPNIYHVG